MNTSTAHITTKQDLSRWARAHTDAPGINWSVHGGPGGTMLITEHEADRAALPREALAGAEAEAAA